MPKYKVFRTKNYEALIFAQTANEAAMLAQELPGRDWTLVKDQVENEVVSGGGGGHEESNGTMHEPKTAA